MYLSFYGTITTTALEGGPPVIKPHSLLKSPFNTILFCIMSKMVIMTTAIVIMMAMMVYGKDDGRVLFFFYLQKGLRYLWMRDQS